MVGPVRQIWLSISSILVTISRLSIRAIAWSFKHPLVRKEVQKMLDEDAIEPSISPWNSPICLVSKKQTGEWWFCVDLRKLNSITRTDTYPLPRINETLERLFNSKFYST